MLLMNNLATKTKRKQLVGSGFGAKGDVEMLMYKLNNKFYNINKRQLDNNEQREKVAKAQPLVPQTIKTLRKNHKY